MSSVRKSFLLSLADSYLGIVLQIVGTVVISRLLTPAEVGVFAITAVFVMLAGMFRDFGVAEYLIQEQDLTKERIRATLALNILVSWAMALTLAVAAPFLADFYREEGVQSVMWVQALNLMMVPFGAVTLAWFRRQLNYTPIVICNVLASVATLVVSVGLALSGYGYMSLAWGSFAGIAATVISSMVLKPRELPRWPSFKGMAHVFHFGKFASSIYLIGQLGKGAPELIIGRVENAASVGFFSRANGIVEMFNRLLLRPAMNVCLPYFARGKRDGGSVSASYLLSVSMLTAVGWPFLAVLAICAFPAIRLIYGEQWVVAVPLSRILCLAMAVELVHALSREALIACGSVKRANTLQMQLVVVQVCGLAGGIGFGLQAACWGMVVAAALGVGIAQWHLTREFGFGWLALLGACRLSGGLALVTAAPLLVAAWWIPANEQNYVRWGLCAGSLSVLLWLATAWRLDHQLWRELTAVVARRRRPAP